jgi:hypothetical protein
MAQSSYAGTWTIDITSNPAGYPSGGKQKIIDNLDGTYKLKWRVQDGKEATLSPLTAEGAVLSNEAAVGRIEETDLGTFSVEILLQPALRRIAGFTAQPGVFTTPGQLVGQWGAESTGTTEEEGKPKQDKNGKPGKRPTQKA